jgi:hypothetical protein
LASLLPEKTTWNEQASDFWFAGGENLTFDYGELHSKGFFQVF